MTVPELVLNNGVTMPALGFGVFQTPPDETVAAVETALRRATGTSTPPRHMATSGRWARRSVAADSTGPTCSSRPRCDSDCGYDATRRAFDECAGKLGVERIDLLILHQAMPSRFDLTVDAYRGLESLLSDGGRSRRSGSATTEYLDRFLAETSVVPAVTQVELHPYFTQPAVQAADAAHGILTQAWSPIGGSTSTGKQRPACSATR